MHFQGTCSRFAFQATFWQELLHIYKLCRNLKKKKKSKLFSLRSALHTAAAKTLSASHWFWRPCSGNTLFIVIAESQKIQEGHLIDCKKEKWERTLLNYRLYTVPSINQWAVPTPDLTETPVRLITLSCPCLLVRTTNLWLDGPNAPSVICGV